jgi:hypothetical protein
LAANSSTAPWPISTRQVRLLSRGDRTRNLRQLVANLLPSLVRHDWAKILRKCSPLQVCNCELDQQHLPKYQEVIVPGNWNVSTCSASLMRKCLEGSASFAATGVKLANMALCRRGEAATLALKCLLTRETEQSRVLNPVKYSMFSRSSGISNTVSRAGTSAASKLSAS